LGGKGGRIEVGVGENGRVPRRGHLPPQHIVVPAQACQPLDDQVILAQGNQPVQFLLIEPGFRFNGRCLLRLDLVGDKLGMVKILPILIAPPYQANQVVDFLLG
jgi:hypothetical protein